ncbi:MAG: CxxxxCH/CxxCH domain-containing protein [Thermodesulfobacteriota bacterium]
MKKSMILAGALVLGAAGVANSFYYENSSPHNATNAVACEDCHGAPTWGDPNGSKPFLLNLTAPTGETDCLVCHNNFTGKNYDTANAPGVKTHSSANLGEKHGIWGFDCWNCHQNHSAPPAGQALVTGAITAVSPSGTEMLLNIQNTQVFDKRTGALNDCLDATNDSWCTPAEWMQKTSEQYPYDPYTDKDNPSYIQGPCDPGPDTIPGTADDNFDELYSCEPGVNPGERGLMLWVAYDSGAMAGFEVSYASGSQVMVKGNVAAGETLTASTGTPRAFSLYYGMMVKDTPDAFGFCSPAPILNYCYDAAQNFFTETQCITDNDCTGAETCQPKSTAYQCRTDADCPNNGTCNLQTFAQVNDIFSPNQLAFNENSNPDTHVALGNDPTPVGICQVCHVTTNHWRADGTGADHNNGMVCTSCHSHTTGFQPSGCTSCHGMPPTTNPLPTYGTDGATGSVTAGAHSKHASIAGYHFKCTTCHQQGMPESPVYDMLIQVGFSTPDGSNGAGSTYYGQNSVGNNATPFHYVGTNGTQIALTDPSDPNYMTCKNVYCHSQGKRLVQGFDLPSTSNPWGAGNSDIQGDNFKCNNCHGFPPTFDSHKTHHVRNFTCELCHADTAATATTLVPDKGKHVNGVYDVVPAAEFYARRAWHPLTFNYTFAVGGGTCSNNSCHQLYRYGDPKTWRNETQQISSATLTSVDTGTCSAGATSGAVSVTVTPVCSDCVQPYYCDFEWGDGTISTDVACTNVSHTYADIVPNGTIYDPTSKVIGGFNVTWSIRDIFNVELASGTKVTRIGVCGNTNANPVLNFNMVLGPNANTYDACLVDLSTDADYNVGTHYDPNSPATNYGAPGTIKIDWGGYAADGSGKGLTEAPINLSASPSNASYCFTYDRSGYYYIRHFIRDNDPASSFIASPVKVFKVTK